MKYTPQDLLAAVGINALTGGTCHHGHRLFMGGEYTGPALGTPELDAVLLVEGVKLCRCNWQLYDDVHDAVYKLNEIEIDATDTFALEWLLFHCDQPGHALAAAIKEVVG
jgi:hypothetical protein